MRITSERTWQAAAAASAAAACISGAVFVLSAAGGETVRAALSLSALILFAACAFLAMNTGPKLEAAGRADTEVRCLRLKRPGIEKREDEIKPKAKMPKG
ncbi:MAG: hypothetical protein LBJ20_00150 [Candidatus Methanoplasma sp.]|jgi:hypothetical protein|nr:hypothetical protein [Candidatus Methanoplasma sp.]